MRKLAADVPNGIGISSIPNSSDFGSSQGIQMSDGGGSPGGSPGGEMSDKRPIRDIIADVLLRAARNGSPDEISDIAKEAVSAEVPPELMGNDNAFNMIIALGRRAQEDQSATSINPDTGVKEHSIDQIASQIAQEAGWEVEELIKEAEEREAGGSPLEAHAGKKKEDEERDPLKKKKRGNPFKVLMGKAQKMLDHGASKKDIVNKFKSKWDPDTISRCVDIVKDYNRRKKRKEGPKKTDSFNFKAHMERTASERPGFKYRDSERRESIYDITSEPGMQSTMELLTRMIYLRNASNFNIELSNENPGGIDHEVNKGGAKDQLDAVMAELKRRGYEDDDLSPLVEVATKENQEEG